MWNVCVARILLYETFGMMGGPKLMFPQGPKCNKMVTSQKIEPRGFADDTAHYWSTGLEKY